MKTSFQTIIAVSVITILAACAPKKSDEADRNPTGEDQTLAFQVGSSFQNAPDTKIVIMNMNAGSTYYKRLLFRAPKMGRFQLSEVKTGLGMNCGPIQNMNGDYLINYDYKLKDFRTNQYVITPSVNSIVFIASMQLNTNYELLVTLQIDGHATCGMAEISLTAVFN